MHAKDFSEENLILLKGPDHKVTLPIFEREIVSRDTAIFRLKFPNEKNILGLPVGQHIRI
jgi:NAD(P)H-flavin reductase